MLRYFKDNLVPFFYQAAFPIAAATFLIGLIPQISETFIYTLITLIVVYFFTEDIATLLQKRGGWLPANYLHVILGVVIGTIFIVHLMPVFIGMSPHTAVRFFAALILLSISELLTYFLLVNVLRMK